MKVQLLLLWAALVLAGCGPNLQSLVHEKHYREAVCAAEDGNDSDRVLVGNALDKDADVQLGLHVVSSDELRPILGDRTNESLQRGRILRVVAQSNVLPVDDVELKGTFVTESGRTAALVADWNTLAFLTHEKLPPQRVQQTYMTGENVLKGGAAILTAGLSLLFTSFRPGNVVVDPSPADYEAYAPQASKLHHTTGHSACSYIEVGTGLGRRCTWFFVLDTAPSSRVTFELGTHYVSRRQTGKPSSEKEDRCSVVRFNRVALTTPGNMETFVQERFGGRMQSVRSLVPSK